MFAFELKPTCYLRLHAKRANISYIHSSHRSGTLIHFRVNATKKIILVNNDRVIGRLVT